MILEEMSILSCCRISKSEIKKKSLKNSKSWVYDDGDAYSTVPGSVSGAIKQRILAEEALRNGNARVPAEVFTFRELATATQNFNSELLVGEGGFGRVYKGYLNKTNQVTQNTFHFSRLKLNKLCQCRRSVANLLLTIFTSGIMINTFFL